MTKLTSDQLVALLQLAKSQVGVREQGSPNSGPLVNAYQRSTGNGPGDSWCASFVVWCIQAILGGTSNPLRRSGAVHEVLLEALSEGRGITNPIPGCIGFLLSREKDPSSAYHTFIVTSAIDSNEKFSTVEGNSNDDGSADGIGVFARSRTLGWNTEFILLV